MKSYLVIFEKSSTGYSAYVPDLPGCISTGATREETKENIQEAISLHLEVMEEDGLSIPEGSSEAETLVVE
ncbi:MAG: type II toxin-antitoxin system HicB family antitoxin [Tunicatimonas sp.]